MELEIFAKKQIIVIFDLKFDAGTSFIVTFKTTFRTHKGVHKHSA